MRCDIRRENPGRGTDYSAAGRHISDDGGVGADDHIVTDPYISNHHRASADKDSIAEYRISVRAPRATRTYGYALTDGTFGAQVAVNNDAAEVTDVEPRSDITIARDTDPEQHMDEEFQDAKDQLDRQREPIRTNGPAPAPQPVYGNGQKPELGDRFKSCPPGPMNGPHRAMVSLEIGAQWRLGLVVHRQMAQVRSLFPYSQLEAALFCSVTNTAAPLRAGAA